MKAIQIDQFGGPEHLHLAACVTPKPTADQLLIKVEASGINMADTYIRKGAFPGLPLPPMILGMEGTGRVHAVGSPALNSWLDQRVAFAAPQSYAEFVTVDLGPNGDWQFAQIIDEKLTRAEAAALAMSSRTAYLLGQAPKIPAQEGFALVHAAAGALGSVLVQLLARKGVQVIALTSSAAKAKFAEQLGAYATIDHRNEDVAARIKAIAPNGLRWSFNSSGGNTLARDALLLGDEGELVWFGFAESADAPDLMSTLQQQFMRSPRLTLFNAGKASRSVNQSAVAELCALIAAKQLHIPIHHCYSPEEAGQAHTDLESGKTIGKLVLDFTLPIH